MSYQPMNTIGWSRTARPPEGRHRASSFRERSPAASNFWIFSTTKANAAPLMDGTSDTVTSARVGSAAQLAGLNPRPRGAPPPKAQTGNFVPPLYTAARIAPLGAP